MTVTIVDDDLVTYVPGQGAGPAPSKGGGGEESLITLLLWAALWRMRQVAGKGRR